MANQGIVWERDPSKAWDTAVFKAKLQTAVSATFSFWSPRVQSHARSEAPWTDRTGNARQGLHAVHTHIEGFHNRITLFHTMPYGVFLEVKNSGEYAVIIPTIQEMGPQVMASLRDIIGRMG